MSKRIDYPEDCKRIQDVLFKNGIFSSIHECEELWEQYSSDLQAGWIFVSEFNDDDLWRILEPYVKRELE